MRQRLLLSLSADLRTLSPMTSSHSAGGDHLINDTRGYSAIVQPLSKSLQDVRLNQAVASIVEGDGKYVTVTTQASVRNPP